MSYIAIDKLYIEKRIAELDKTCEIAFETNNWEMFNTYSGIQSAYKHVLQQGIEIPVETNWGNIIGDEGEHIPDDYPNGVIIKQTK